MKISIVIHSNATATVTRTPSWLARLLFGSRETTREAQLVRGIGGHAWLYSETNREVRERQERLVRQ